MLKIIRISAIVTLTISAVACTNSKPVSEPGASEDIFSNRPIAAVPDVYVVALNEPPLLTVATRNGNQVVIPDAAKNAVLQEQAEFESKAKSLSPDLQVIYKYRMTLNAVAIYAPPEVISKLSKLRGVKSVSPARQMARPESLNVQKPEAKVEPVNSATFIGAKAAYARGLKGQGVRVGVLDTGIDYTHKMLGGSGNTADFKSVGPNQPSNLFPNRKVVGGVDLVGSDFSSASPFAQLRLPKPDANPIDEAGHGTHVAGSIAGIGDGSNSYDGVSPEADLYAIKVFGKGGSTMDAVVIAGFEFSADPNGDLDPSDRLDVINLSLGGGFGQPQILYTEAVKNLTRAGTVVVASAGNSGPVDYIVGAPGTSDEAISVAASIDGSPHNWQFAAVRFASPGNSNWMAKATEGPISKPIAQVDPSTGGDLVDIGFADTDLSDAIKARLNGRVALIQRGKVPFFDKLTRAQDAGAVGAVVYNNEPGKPIPMGGDPEKTVNIPAIMVSQALGMKLKEEMTKGNVSVVFKTGEKIEEPELVDTITEFSSKGPRSEDNLLKPEIAAPGQRIISAAMGEGSGAVQMDGTSMSAPHLAGVMALVKQAYPNLTPAELKALVMNTAKPLTAKGQPVPVTLQGAGRVQIDAAITAQALVEPAGLNLGRVQIGDAKTETRKLVVKNISAEALELTTRVTATIGLELNVPGSITLAPGASVEVPVTARFQLQQLDKFSSELNGRIEFLRGGQVVAQVPALAIRTQASAITGSKTGDAITMVNASPVTGLGLAFNLLGEDPRKAMPAPNESWRSRSCDLQSVGYRLLRKTSRTGQVRDVVQLAFKLHTPLTTWHLCEVSVLIDRDGDGEAEQELAGVSAAGVEGVSGIPFASILLDAKKAREIRQQYENELAAGKEVDMNFQPAILAGSPMVPFSHSSIAVIEAPLDALAKSDDGSLNIKVAALGGGGDLIEADDYLGGELGDWMKIPSVIEQQPYYGMPEISEVAPTTGGSLVLSKGSGTGRAVVYYPFNENDGSKDSQAQIFD